MEFEKIKKLFYALFVFDILAGVFAGYFMSVFHGIAAGSVLLVLNITVYAIILKMQKIKERSGGFEKKGNDI